MYQELGMLGLRLMVQDECVMHSSLNSGCLLHQNSVQRSVWFNN